MNIGEFITKLQTEMEYITTNNYDDFEIVVCTNENEYTICNGTAFVGGLEGTLMCDVLGNVAYNTIESIGEDLYDYISRSDEVIENVEFI